MYIHFIKRSEQAGYIMRLLLPHKQDRNQLLYFFAMSVGSGISKVVTYISMW